MKRFTETTKWADPWFQDLPAKHKLFWLYICDACDGAGVWNANLKLAAFHLGEQLDEKDLLETFAGRIESLGNGYWWILRFCDFQYTALNPMCRPHEKVIQTLQKHGLFDRYVEARKRKRIP